VPDIASGWKLLESGDRVESALLDVDLRGVKVFSLARALRQRGIPIVFATGYGVEAVPEHWRSCPRLEKPFDAKALGTCSGGPCARGRRRRCELPRRRRWRNPPRS